MADKKENFETEEVKEETAEETTAEETQEVKEESKEETKEEKDDSSEETSEDVEEKEEKPKKKFGKKKDKRDEQIEELTDKVKRQLAEFENFRTRSEKEKSQMYDMGAKTIVEKILPVVDNFERGLAGVEEGDAFADGMKMIYKQLMSALEEAGVTPIEAVGKEFDPEFHNAVMQVESEEFESGVVAQELQKGYMYRDSVVRHSMVAVVQ
ncbi:MAG: nucleotide exchange factor GrpE [Lachnospiraceae bacterium]|nr:nucleotide exchange factor GrpE [Lachnospiraceae bacterium]